MPPPPQEPVPNDLKGSHEAPAYKDSATSQSSKFEDQSHHAMILWGDASDLDKG